MSSTDAGTRDEPRGGIARRGFLLGTAALSLAGALALAEDGPFGRRLDADAAIAATTADPATEIERIRSLLVANWVSRDYLDDGSSARVEWTLQSQALTYLAAQNADGSWADVDYTATGSAANGKPWPPYEALDRMQAMAAAYANPSGPNYQNATLLDGVSRAIDFWVSAEPTSTNWWETQIGIQLRMFRIGLMLKHQLTAARLAAIQGTLRTDLSYTPSSTGTGENAVWYAQEIVANGLLQDDPALITFGRDALAAAIVTNTGDGMQPDNSYHQHGQQLYIDGYGRDQFTDISHWMWALAGTSYAFSTIAVSDHLAYVLEGMRWFIKGEHEEFNILIDPGPWYVRNSQRLSESLGWLKTAVPDQAQRFAQFADNIALLTRDNGSTGSKYFWNSDFLTHQRLQWALGIKMVSKRTVGSETRYANAANVNYLWWMPFGGTFISQRGNEFTDLFPVWDWTKIPGVTNPSVLESLNAASPYTESTTFVGGVDNGLYGAAVQDFNKSNTVAKKSWFCFDDEFVALGAGITSTDPNTITTSINQTITNGRVLVQGTTIPHGATRALPARWAHHDDIAYVFPTPTTVNVKNVTATGSWDKIGSPQDPTVITKNVFGLWLDHGVGPTNASYEYVVRPGIGQTQAPAYATALPVSVLSNTPALQAVRHNRLGITELVFWTAGSARLRPGLTVEVSQPCLLIVDEGAGRAPALTISNPGASFDVDVTLTLNGVAKTTTVPLPNGTLLGRSVSVNGPFNDAAYRSPVLASSQQSSKSATHYLTDGNPRTQWAAANGDRQWVRVDLQTLRILNQVNLTWGEGHASAFSVDLSADGDSWTTVYSTMKGRGDSVSIPFTTTTARFVRVNLTKRATASAFSLAALEAIQPPDLAVGATATASSSANLVPAADAVDGDLGTRWGSAYADPQTISIDMGVSHALRLIVLRWETASAKAYTVDVSTDGSTWTNVYTTTTGAGGVVTIPVEVSARFIRMNGTVRNTKYGYSLWEIEAYA